MRSTFQRSSQLGPVRAKIGGVRGVGVIRTGPLRIETAHPDLVVDQVTIPTGAANAAFSVTVVGHAAGRCRRAW